MAFKKITDEDVKGKGNVGRPDTPGVSTAEMQRIMDEIPREVIIPAFNLLIDALADKTSAAMLGITAPAGIAGSTVQEVVNALLAYVNAHKNDQENPHAVTAAQVDAYTKKQTDDVINKKVIEIGAGDMAQAVYDPTGQRKDVFAAAMLRATYDTKNRGVDVYNYADDTAATHANAVAAKYEAKLSLDSWVDSTSEEQAGGYTQAQEVTLTAVTPGAPTVIAASEFLTGCGYDPTGVAATDEILDEVLSIVNAGVTRSLDGGKVRVIVKEKPAAEIVVNWIIRTEVE